MKKLKGIAKATPNVAKLKIEYDVLEYLENFSKISTIVQKYWSKNLVKIEMFGDLLYAIYHY